MNYVSKTNPWSIIQVIQGEYVDESAQTQAAAAARSRAQVQRGPGKPATNVPLAVLSGTNGEAYCFQSAPSHVRIFNYVCSLPDIFLK